MKAWFVYPVNPWSVRSCHYSRGSGSGIFSILYTRGFMDSAGSFRVVPYTMECFRDLFMRLGLFHMAIRGVCEVIIFQ